MEALGGAWGFLSKPGNKGILLLTQETEGFKIDTMGTYHGMTLKSVTVSGAGRGGSGVPARRSRKACSRRACEGQRGRRSLLFGVSPLRLFSLVTGCVDRSVR